MGERPKGMTLDRVDNKGNYEPSNCKWSTYSEQSLNQKTSGKNNTTGQPYIYPNRDKFAVVFRNKEGHIGSYETVEEAIIIRDEVLDARS